MVAMFVAAPTPGTMFVVPVIPTAMFVAHPWVDEVAMFVAPLGMAAMFVGPGLQNDNAMFVALIICAATFVVCQKGQWYCVSRRSWV